MAYIGMKYPIFVPITEEPDNAVPVYGSGIVLGHAISADVKIERANNKLIGDDGVVETYTGVIGGTISLGLDDISKEVYKVWFGAEEDETGAIIDKGDVSSPFGGCGYYAVKQKNQKITIRAYFYYKTQFSANSESAKTKSESGVEWQTPTIEGNFYTLNKEGRNFRTWNDFPNESAAVAWLKSIAKIGDPAVITELNDSISAAEILDPEEYTSASWVAVAVALSKAKAVAAQEFPQPYNVNTAKSALDAAVEALITA